jgi:hypothetical protein
MLFLVSRSPCASPSPSPSSFCSVRTINAIQLPLLMTIPSKSSSKSEISCSPRDGHEQTEVKIDAQEQEHLRHLSHSS